MKNRILLRLTMELNNAMEKEKQSVLELENLEHSTSLYKRSEKYALVLGDTGYVNGLLEAINIVERTKYEEN